MAILASNNPFTTQPAIVTPTLFKGNFISVASLVETHPNPEAGSTANIIRNGATDDLAIWDTGDATWVIFPGQAVTKAQVGLDQVDNTSDLAKPVSTLQGTADANTLNSANTYADSLITQIIDGAPADGNTLKELNDKILAVQAIIGGITPDGDTLVNTVAELLAVFSTYTEGVDLVTLLAGKVNTTDVYNALDCIVAGKTLDARQGKALKDLIDTLTIVVSGKEPANANIQAHVTAPHAPADAQKNSDITKAEIEAKLTGEVSTHSHAGGSASVLEIVTVAGTAYTFLLTDAQKKVLFTSATAVSATIPTNAVTAIPIGSKIEITQSGAGIVTLVTTGLTITSATTSPITLVQGQTVYLVKTAINSWTIDLNIQASGTQTVSGLKTFLQDTLGLRNAANTFTSFFRNANTAQRIYTLPNKDGTVAMTSDIIAQLNGTINYLVKFGTATTGVVSRLWDTGTFFGIGTFLAPTKDITLGNQANKEIGIEQSDSTTIGRDLTISGGRTVNYQLTVDFVPLYQLYLNWHGVAVSSNGDVYSSVNGGDIYVQTNGSGNFASLGQTSRPWYQLSANQSGDIYAVDANNIYKRTNGEGNFISLAQTTRDYRGVTVAPNGNVYTCVVGGDIYMQTNGSGSFNALGQTSRSWRNMASAPNGDIYAVDANNIYKRTNGEGNFISLAQTIRSWTSITVAPNGNVYAGNYGGDIYMQTNGSGNFVSLGQTSRSWSGLASNSNNDIYAVVFAADIYKQNNFALGTPNLDGGTLIHKAGTGKGTGKSRLHFITGQKTASGTNMQIETLREYIDENGHHVYTSMPIYADNASAIAGGLVVGTQYRTATGDLKIVY